MICFQLIWKIDRGGKYAEMIRTVYMYKVYPNVKSMYLQYFVRYVEY